MPKGFRWLQKEYSDYLKGYMVSDKIATWNKLDMVANGSCFWLFSRCWCFFFFFLYSNQGVQGQIDKFAKVEDQAQLVPHAMTKKYRNRVVINLTLFIQRGMARSMGNFGWGLNLPFMYERTWCLENEDNNEDGRWSRAYTCLNQGNNNFRRLVKNHIQRHRWLYY